jgi:hypothetical protein
MQILDAEFDLALFGFEEEAVEPAPMLTPPPAGEGDGGIPGAGRAPSGRAGACLSSTKSGFCLVHRWKAVPRQAPWPVNFIVGGQKAAFHCELGPPHPEAKA